MFTQRVSVDSGTMKGGNSTIPYPTKKQTRPLGSMRKARSTIDTVPMFPPLATVTGYQGVSGSALPHLQKMVFTGSCELQVGQINSSSTTG